MFQSLTDLQRKIDSRRGTSRPKGSKSNTRRRIRTSSGSSDSKESSGDTSSSSPSTTLTTFWFWCTSSRIYLSLQAYQTLQHGSIQLVLLFLGFNQASHGGCNIWWCLLESPSIRLYVIISNSDIFCYGISCTLVGVLSIISVMGSHDWTTTHFTTLLYLEYFSWRCL